ncbi:hypothetical protein RMSM_01611 [Rhodopirellula maiorica SM1]|uniref:Uncharacterized protein n=1 Tax=Rhodopirellula maiorica SM1 TaxID=1265738 RepID=M5S1D5_9BACT|nr:hypothetical protein [Rhodopirellula maiorica]EMI21467.1 hypothetical protein RMSM_01611 [Rhodopirellula maiorica SM1]
MSQSEFLSTSSLTPKKLALIVVLVGVLGFVLFSPEQKSDEFDMPPSLRKSRAITKASFRKSSDNLAAAADWPDVNLDHVLATNPFETIFVKAQTPVAIKEEEKPEVPQVVATPVVIEPTPVEPQTTIEHRPHDEVEIIYENTSGRIAVIGSKLVRVGDILPQGRVVEITPKQVIVAVEIPLDPVVSETTSTELDLRAQVTGKPLTAVPAESSIPTRLED